MTTPNYLLTCMAFDTVYTPSRLGRLYLAAFSESISDSELQRLLDGLVACDDLEEIVSDTPPHILYRRIRKPPNRS